MAIWMFRAGKAGQWERKFLEEGKIYLTWNDLRIDLSRFKDKEELKQNLPESYFSNNSNVIRNWLSQIWPIAHRVKVGDWVVLPSKTKSALHFGKITGDYVFDSQAENPFYHYRKVEWFAVDIPRSNFDQDILYSLGAFLTVCRIHRNDAEKRIKEMAANNWVSQPVRIERASVSNDETDELQDSISDLEEIANDQIAKFLIRKFKGHGMAFIVDAILRAKGYTTHQSPPGPDMGVDLLAAPEPMGFGNPRICVQVKSGDSQVDRPTLDQLLGSMQNFGASQGLLVSWGGFKSSVEREIPKQFFRIRLWGQKEIIQELLLHYDRLDESIRAEIPLKRIWAISTVEDE